MAPLSLSLAVRNLKKNRRNTISIALGLFIALTLFTSVNFNLNLSRTDIIRSNNFDFTIQGSYHYTGSFTNFVKDNKTWNEIASEPEVSNVVPYTLFTSSYTVESTVKYNDYSLYGIQQSYFNTLKKEGKIGLYSGSMELNSSLKTNTSIPVIGLKFSNTGPLNQSYPFMTYTPNNNRLEYNFTVVGWITLNTENTIFSSISTNTVSNYLDSYYFISFFDKLDSSTATQMSLKIYIKSQYINLDNLDQTATTYSNIVTKLNQKYPNYSFYSSLAGTLLIVNIQIALFQLIVLMFLLPFFFIALYISHLASQLNLENRRIQYGLFLVRGGKANTIKNSYRLEGLILGLLNGIIAFVLTPFSGYILHYFLPQTTLTPSFTDVTISYFSNLNHYYDLLWSMFIGGFLGYLIMYIPHYYTFLNPKELLETHRVEETDITLKGRKDIIAFLIGISPIVFAIAVYLTGVLHLPFIVTVVLFQLGTLTVYVLPFSPFLITYGLSAYLARQTKILKKITDFYAHFIPDLREIINKTIFSKINNLSRIAFVISFAFTFIIIPLCISGSLTVYNTQTQTYRVGSDLALNSYNPEVINESYLSTLSFVKSSTTVYSGYDNNLNLYYINPSTYINTANFKSFWNLQKDMLDKLSNKTIIVNNNVLSSFNVKVGESLQVKGEFYTIIGTFSGLGGTDNFISTIPQVILNSNQLNSSSLARLLVKFTDPSNKTAISSFVSTLQGRDPTVQILSYYIIGDVPQHFDIIVFVLSLIEIQAYLLGILSLISLAFLMIIRIRERSREIGNWRSRGLDQNQLRKLITVELLILSSFGFLIGFFAGLSLAFAVYIALSSLLFGSNSIIPYDFVIPINIIYIALVYIVGTLIIALLINYWTFHMNLSKQLRYEDYAR